jgi:DNA-binding MarR family transcriptional regulator
MDSGLAERGLTASRAEVIIVLRSTGPLVQRELGRALRCSARHVTTLVDALEADGFVERRSHPTDRRATLVALTEQGAAAAARMETERHEAAHAALAAFVMVVDRLLGLIGAATSGPSSRSRARTGDVQV